jgi:hypothetical protein
MSRTARAVVLIAGFAAIGLLIAHLGPRLLFDLLAQVGWHIVPIMVVYAAHVLTRAVSLWSVIVDRRVRFADVLRVRLSAEAVEVLTYTGPFLAEPAKGWLLTRRGLSATEAFAAVATEYLLYTTVSAALALFGFAALATTAALPPSVRPLAMMTATAMAAFLVAFLFAAISGIGLIAPILGSLGPVIGRSRATQAAAAFAPIEQLLIDFLHTRPARLTWVLITEAIGHALFLVEIWIVFVALDVPFSLHDAVVFEGGTKIGAVAFFYIPGQVGASEAMYAALARAIGLSASIGLALALIRRLRSLAIASVGLLTLSVADRHTAAP